jgi:hypothetical protein
MQAQLSAFRQETVAGNLWAVTRDADAVLLELEPRPTRWLARALPANRRHAGVRQGQPQKLRVRRPGRPHEPIRGAHEARAGYATRRYAEAAFPAALRASGSCYPHLTASLTHTRSYLPPSAADLGFDWRLNAELSRHEEQDRRTDGCDGGCSVRSVGGHGHYTDMSNDVRAASTVVHTSGYVCSSVASAHKERHTASLALAYALLRAPPC